MNKKVEHWQLRQELAYDSSTKKRDFKEGDSVYAQGIGTGSRWLSCVVQEVTGLVSIIVKLQAVEKTSGPILRPRKHNVEMRSTDMSQSTTPSEKISEVEIPVTSK